jgi:hypothetical protein
MDSGSWVADALDKWHVPLSVTSWLLWPGISPKDSLGTPRSSEQALGFSGKPAKLTKQNFLRVNAVTTISLAREINF